jgi:dynein heavy chain
MVFFHFSWIPTCAKAFVDNKDYWQYLVPEEDGDSTALIQQFFSCVAAVMSTQLRGMVINSLIDFLAFFEIHKVGSNIK